MGFAKHRHHVWKPGLAGKNLRDLFPRVRGKNVGKKGVITQFFPSMGEKPISTTHNFFFILFQGYLGQNRAYI